MDIAQVRFSDRYGYTAAPADVIQRERISDELRNLLWDSVAQLLRSETDSFDGLSWQPHTEGMFRYIWRSHFKSPQDTLPSARIDALKIVRKWFFAANWWEIYNFLEIAYRGAQKAWSESTAHSLQKALNSTLNSENAAYRMVDGRMVETVDDVSMEAVSVAVTSRSEQVKLHISTALSLLADRNADQSRNVVKEAISAVEAAAREISGKQKATLGDALKALRGDAVLHPSLAQAFDKLYGFTNDAEGIRHALLDEPNLDKFDAWFFLVACSAFVNLLASRRVAPREEIQGPR